MGWYANTIFHDTTVTEGDYYIAKDLLKETVAVPVKDSIARLIEHDKINARRSEALSKQTLSALETQNRHAAEQAQSTRELVEQAGARNELLQSQNIEMELQTSKLSEVNFNLEALGREMSGVKSLLDWRLSEITGLLSGMKLSLEQLVEIAKTPSQTWAAEQFDIARDAYSNALYDEALTYIENAISGTGSQTGYIMDHRYHFLKARVLFGDGDRRAHELVDFIKSEQAFLKAERYSRIGSDKAMSLCGAALSACGQGQDGVAMEHLNNAKKKDNTHPETRYILAKLHFKNNDIDKGESELRAAYDNDIFYVSKSVADAESQNFVNNRDKVIMQFHGDIVGSIKNKVAGEIARYSKANEALEGLNMTTDPSIQETHKALMDTVHYFKNLTPSAMSVYEANHYSDNFHHTIEMRASKGKAAISRDRQRTETSLGAAQSRMSRESNAALPSISDRENLKTSYRGNKENMQWTIGGIIFILMFVGIGGWFYWDVRPVTGAGKFFTVVGALITAAIGSAIASIVVMPTYALLSHLFVNASASNNANKIQREQKEKRAEAEVHKDSKIGTARKVVVKQEEIEARQSEALGAVTKILSLKD